MGFRNRDSCSKSKLPRKSEPLIDTSCSNRGQELTDYGRPHDFRLVLFSDSKREIPQALCAEVLKSKCPAVVKRDWRSVVANLHACDLIIDCSDSINGALRRIDEVSRKLAEENHAIRPSYLVVSATSRYPLARFEVEFRRGAYFLYRHDLPGRFSGELEQIRLRQREFERSSPRWLIEYQGNGQTLQVNVSFVSHRGLAVVRAADSLAAELAVLITNNGIPRSIASWRNILMGSPLFKPAGGGFNVPSRTTFRMHIHRDYIRVLQRAFDEARSGYCAKRVLERIRLGEKTVGYRIKGRWDPVRR
jgi:hypothetical protein